MIIWDVIVDLMSISYFTKELIFVVLMYLNVFYYRILSRGKWLSMKLSADSYNVDYATQHNTKTLAHGSADTQQWLRHKRLAHPSSWNIHMLFPTLFPYDNKFSCETSILSKSHKQPYHPSNTRQKSISLILHSFVWPPYPNYKPCMNNIGFMYFVLFIVIVLE